MVVGSLCLITTLTHIPTPPPPATVKVRMQARPDAFNGPIQCLLSTLREEGVRALWKGSVPALVRCLFPPFVFFVCDSRRGPWGVGLGGHRSTTMGHRAPPLRQHPPPSPPIPTPQQPTHPQVGAVSENAVAFSVNQQLKRVLANADAYGLEWLAPPPPAAGEDESLLVPFLTGGFTGIFTSAALCPSDVIKCKVGVVCWGMIVVVVFVLFRRWCLSDCPPFPFLKPPIYLPPTGASLPRDAQERGARHGRQGDAPARPPHAGKERHMPTHACTRMPAA